MVNSSEPPCQGESSRDERDRTREAEPSQAGKRVPEFVATPAPPYVAVIITTVHTGDDLPGYRAMSEEMYALVANQPGYLGEEAAHDWVSLSVPYWRDQASAEGWKRGAAHRAAQRRARERWYSDYRVRVATVERDYTMHRQSPDGRPGSS